MHAQGRSDQGHGLKDNPQELRSFRLFLRAYVYSREKATFVPIPAMPSHLSRQIRKAVDALHRIDTAGITTTIFDFHVTSHLVRSPSLVPHPSRWA